jgi:hypothetical protein
MGSTILAAISRGCHASIQEASIVSPPHVNCKVLFGRDVRPDGRVGVNMDKRTATG